MEKETLKALKGSIKKWKKIERSTRALDEGAKNCPLCALYYMTNINAICKECPVNINGQKAGCCNTPYFEWLDHQQDKHPHFKEHHRGRNCPTCLELATKERKFLESLLPKGEK